MGEKLAGFKKELTCSICKNLFKEPKTLACLHTFCEGCLSYHINMIKKRHDFLAEDASYNVPCPKCKHVEILNAADVSLVRTNLAFKNMVEHLSLEEGVRAEFSSLELEDFSSSTEIVTHYTWKCGKHRGDVSSSKEVTDVSLYCKDDDEMICMMCAICVPHGSHNICEDNQ